MRKRRKQPDNITPISRTVKHPLPTDDPYMQRLLDVCARILADVALVRAGVLPKAG